MTAALSASERTLLMETLAAIFRDHEGSDVTAALLDFGADDVLRADRAHAIPTIFELQGSTGSRSTMLGRVMAMSLAPVLTNCTDTAVVLPTTSSSASPVSGGCTSVAGILMESMSPATVVIGSESAGGFVGIIDLGEHPHDLRPLSGIDPTLALTSLTVERVPAGRLIISDAGAAAWQQAVMWGRIALAAELVGCGRTALALATDHAANRRQFGAPIGSFQAVKHRLANALIEIEAAAAAVEAAAARPTRLGAMVAKSAAGRAARCACANALQVLGAVGFTLEHPFQRFQRRCIALDHLLGSSDDMPRHIGAELRTFGNIPILVDIEDGQ